MIVMDRENLYAPGWSHVLSTTNDLDELEAFRERVGAPPQALHLGRRGPISTSSSSRASAHSALPRCGCSSGPPT